MMSDFIKVNEGDLIPLQTLKRIREVTDADRQSLADLGPHVDAAKFHTRLEFENGSKSFATQAVADFKEQGIQLVQIDETVFIPADNIIKARDLSNEDRREIEARIGKALREDFCAQVETKAGMVLATIDAGKVMHRMAHPEYTA